jgi:hypothetical protein
MIEAGGIQYERESQIPDGVPYLSKGGMGPCLLCYAQKDIKEKTGYCITMSHYSASATVIGSLCLEHAQKLLPAIQALCNEPPQEKTRKKKRT